MRYFRHLFAILFITATLIGALHEIIHDHHDSISAESCPLALLAQTPTLLNDPFAFVSIHLPDTPFFKVLSALFILRLIPLKSRSPPPVYLLIRN